MADLQGHLVAADWPGKSLWPISELAVSATAMTVAKDVAKDVLYYI